MSYHNAVIISEIGEQDETLYELSFVGEAEDLDYSGNQTDYINADEAIEIAEDVAQESGAKIYWECIKPSGAPGIEAIRSLERSNMC